MEKKVKSVVHVGETLHLKDILFRCSERGFAVYDTHKKEFNVWVFDTSIKEKDFFLLNQKTALTDLQDNPNVIDLYEEIVVDKTTVCLVTERVDKETIAMGMADMAMIDHDIFSLGIVICKILAHLHESHKVGNFISPEYIFLDKTVGYKCVNFTLCFDKEQVQITNKEILQSKLFSQNRAGEPGAYSDNIQKEDDLLCLGHLLYHLCYSNLDIKKDPHDPNKIVFPEKPKHAFGIQSTIEACLLQHKTQRIQPNDILIDFENEQRLDLPENIGSNDSTIMANISLQQLSERERTPNADGLKPGFMSSISKMFTVATTETEGWFLSYIAEDSNAPNDEFVNKILDKCWKKKYKAKKLFDIIDKYTDDQNTLRNSLIISKTLCFLHEIMLKGPSEILTLPLCEKIKKAKKSPAATSSCSYLNYLLLKVRTDWEVIAKGGLKDKHDKIRTQAFSYIIYFYSLVLTEKSKFCLDYQNTFSGNFSVEPLTRTQDVKVIFCQKTFIDLNSYCSTFLRFFKLLSDDIGVRAIQFTIIKNMATEINNVLGVICHFISTYKKVAFSFEEVNYDKMSKMVEHLESSLDNCIIRFHYTLEDMKHNSSFKIFAELLPYSTLTAVSELKQVRPLPHPITSFDIDQYLPLNEFIGSFSLANPFGAGTNKKVTSNEEKVLMIKREVVKDSKLDIKRPQPTSSTYVSPQQKSRSIMVSSTKQTSEFERPKDEDVMREDQNGSPVYSPDKDNPKENGTVLFLQPKQVANGMARTAYVNLEDEMEYQNKDEGPRTQPKKKSARDKLHEDRSNSPMQNRSRSPHLQVGRPQHPHATRGGQFIPAKNLKNPYVEEVDLLGDKENYKAFDDSYDSNNNDQAKSPLLNERGEALVYNAGNHLDQEFLKMIPIGIQMAAPPAPLIKEDKGVQCDFPIETPEKKEQIKPFEEAKDKGGEDDGLAVFDLKVFMKDEIVSDIQGWIIKYSDLTFEKEIANGSTCTVFKGEYRGLPVAIKKLKVDVDKKFMKEFKRELAVMLRIRPHPNLVSFIGVCNEEGHLILVTEYCQGGTLFNLLHKNRQMKLSMKQRKKIMIDVARGMIFLHENNTKVIHRDLKSLNLLFDCPIENDTMMNFNVKIADFGLAKVVDPTSHHMTSYMGTFHWMAPEILNNENYTLKADVYSFAVSKVRIIQVVMWEILARLTPFAELKNPNAIVKYVAVDKGRPRLQDIPPNTSPELIALMVKCWDDTPENRPTFAAILGALSKIEV